MVSTEYRKPIYVYIFLSLKALKIKIKKHGTHGTHLNILIIIIYNIICIYMIILRKPLQEINSGEYFYPVLTWYSPQEKYSSGKSVTLDRTTV